jgi:ATP phosphoribosyltransferase
MNAQRKTSDNVARQPDTYALASQLGMTLDADTCMLVDSLTDTQAILLLEKLEGKERAHRMMDELMQRMEEHKQ